MLKKNKQTKKKHYAICYFTVIPKLRFCCTFHKNHKTMLVSEGGANVLGWADGCSELCVFSNSKQYIDSWIQ